MQELKSYLQDRWVSGDGEGSPLHNPATGEVVATVSTKGLDLSAALEHARKTGGPALREMSFAQRGDLLAAVAELIHESRTELIDLSRVNTGTTRSDSKFDVDGGAVTLATYAEQGRELGDRTFFLDGDGMQLGRSPRFWGQHIRVPLRGVAAHINAFNFPIWGLAEKLACSILAGMPVLTKPATATALPTFRLGELMVESGIFPAGVWSLLCGGAGDLLTHLGSQDVVAFTGSADTARTIRSLPNIIERNVRVNIEADSLNAVVVGPDVEPGTETWALFLREVTREITQKSGQKCTATRRVFLPQGLIDRAVEDLSEQLAEIKVGAPDQDGVRMGTLATLAQRRDVCSGLAQLAEVTRVVHGELPGESEDALIHPILLRCDDPGNTSEVHQIEVFGPVCVLMPYDGTAQEAAALVARADGCLVSTVYSDDRSFTAAALMEMAPYNGRVLLGSKRIAEHSTGPGLVFPTLAHGGPGRAGGGLELGGLRGLGPYLQTCAVQGARPILDKIL